MNPVLQTIIDVAEKCDSAELDRYQALSEFKKSDEEVNSLIANHSVPKAEAGRMCGLSENTFREKVKIAIAEGVISEPVFYKGKYLFTLEHLHAMMDWLKVPRKKDLHKCIVTNMQNNKGGTGKSVTTYTLATGIALDIKQRARVLVIDLDPHGTLRNFVAAKPSDYQFMLTAVDLMLGENEKGSLYEQYRDGGYEHEQLVKDSVLKTHIPNLDVLPSFETDDRFNEFASSVYFKTGKMDDALNLMESKVLSFLREDYDYIFIDTGPHSTPLVWSTMNFCDGIILPVTPRKLDWIVTSACLNNIENIYKQLPSKGDNLKFSKLLIVNYDDEQNRDTDMMYYIQETVGKFCLNGMIKRSSAFEVANKHYRTIYDFKAADKMCPKTQLDKAISSMKDVIRDFNILMNNVRGEK